MCFGGSIRGSADVEGMKSACRRPACDARSGSRGDRRLGVLPLMAASIAGEARTAEDEQGNVPDVRAAFVARSVVPSLP